MIKMLTAYIVDDEPLARDELKYLLHRTKKVKVLGDSDNMEEAIADIIILKPDLVFLDIELDEESGLDLAKQLENVDPTPAIIFATAYDEYALQAFEANTFDYILKPFDEKRIEKTLDKFMNLQKIVKEEMPPANELTTDYNGRFPIIVDDRIVLLSHDDIIYLETSDGKVKIKTVDHEYKVDETLVSLEKKLHSKKFLRVHRSFIVNMEYITEIQPWFNSTYNLVMKDQSKVPVSRTYVKDLKNHIGF